MILVIDGQGGKMGKEIVKRIADKFPNEELIAVGTNSLATENMLKGGASKGATGENSVKVLSARADIIVGPIGIVIANALLGEVTPGIAYAVGNSNAKRILLPVNRCDTIIAGIGSNSVSDLIEDCIRKIQAILNK